MAAIHLSPTFPQEGPTNFGECLKSLRWNVQRHQCVNQHRRERALHKNHPSTMIHEFGAPRLYSLHRVVYHRLQLRREDLADAMGQPHVLEREGANLATKNVTRQRHAYACREICKWSNLLLLRIL
jgi:hypothetical protein